MIAVLFATGGYMGKVFMYEHIYNDIVCSIREGTYKEDDLLPSEKKLMALYQVSRITTNKAMSMLAKQGLILRIQGRGTYVAPGAKERLTILEMGVGGFRKTAATELIGVIFDHFDLDFGSDLIKSIELNCRKENLDMIFHCSNGSTAEEDGAIQNALARGAKGIILMAVQGEKYSGTILKLMLSHFPVVLVDREMSGIDIPCVKTDNYSASREMTEYVISEGHKKICMVSHEERNTSTIVDRINGFRDSVLSHPECNGSLRILEGYYTAQNQDVGEYVNCDVNQIREIVELEKESTAFFTMEYKIGSLLARICKESGTGHEVFTFDGLRDPYTDPAHLTHVKQDETKMGQEAVRLLVSIMQGKEADKIINVPYTIVGDGHKKIALD